MIYAVLMVKDEGDVIGGTLAHLVSEGVDGIVVADNLSTDRTRDVLDSFSFDGDLVVLDDPDPGYRQSEKMTALADLAYQRGAEWVIPVDADEVWTAPLRLADTLRSLPERTHVVGCAIWNHFPSGLDEPGDPFQTIRWRQPERAPLDKACARWTPGMVIDQGNHSISRNGRKIPGAGAGLALRHYPYRSWEQFRSKVVNGAAAYKAADLPESMGAHWRQYGQILETRGDDALREVFETWFWFLSPLDSGLVEDPAPYLRWSNDV